MAKKKKAAKKKAKTATKKEEPKVDSPASEPAGESAAAPKKTAKKKTAKAAKKKKKKKQGKARENLPMSKVLMGEGTKEVTKTEVAALAQSIGAISDPERLLAPVKFLLPTGCSGLDAALGGGWYSGRMHEIIGEYSTGKSTLVEHGLASCQALGGIAMFISSEATIDLDRMQRLGVDVSNVVWVETQSLEVGFEKLEGFLRNAPPNRLLLIGWDTIAACMSDDTRPGSASRVVREACRWLPNLLAARSAILLFANQTAVTFDMFSTEPANPHGAGIRFHCTARIMLRGKKRVDENCLPLAEGGKLAPSGTLPKADVIKNKKFPPFRRCYMPINFANGIDDDMSLWYWFEKSPVFKKAGGWNYICYDYKEESPTQYSNAFQVSNWRQVLNETEGLRAWLKSEAIQMARQGFDPTKLRS